MSRARPTGSPVVLLILSLMLIVGFIGWTAYAGFSLGISIMVLAPLAVVAAVVFARARATRGD